MVASCASASGSDRVFKPPQGYPKTAGYVEVVFDSHHDGLRAIHTEDLIWFKGRRKYRIATLTTQTAAPRSKTWMNLSVCDGRFIYWATDLGRLPGRMKWYVWPESLARDFKPLDTSLTKTWKIENAKLVGHERMLGMPVEHWSGVNHAKKGDIEKHLWISTDPRFPLVMKVKSQSEWSSLDWRITELDLNGPVPNYLFTAQTFPRGGVYPLLLGYKPPGLVVVWYALFLAALGGLIVFLSKHRNVWSSLGAGTSLIALYFLLRYMMDFQVYMLSISGLPVMVALALVTGVFIALMLRILGRLGDVSFFGGTTWASAGIALAALLISTLYNQAAYAPYVRSLGLPNWRISFQPAPLLNILVFVSGIAAVEELVFRGYLFSALQSRLKSVWLVILLQAIIFGLYHMPGGLRNDDVAFVTLFGIVFGVLRWRYRNLGVPWLVHVALNTGILYVSSLSSLAYVDAVKAIRHL